MLNRCLVKSILLLAMAFIYCGAMAQKPTSGNTPAWVTVSKLDYTNTKLDHEAEDGYVDVAFEKQVNVQLQATYIKHSYRIISEAGVQNRSQISVDFDPSYQKLVFHTIQVIRNGQTINRLDLSKIKTIQPESGLDNFIYDGSKQAILFVDDVRKGDVLEYSFSLVGFNPIFSKYSDQFTTAYPSPIYNLYYKVIMPVSRNLNIKNSGESTTADVHVVGTNTTYEWKKSMVKSLHPDDHLPGWYNAYPTVMVSEYNSWKEVNDWALALFPKNITLSKELQQKIQEIKTAYNTDESRAGAALRFVQDDIRYMGMEMGVHSHKPVNPNKVFEQRFGDCKEKSYLLCTMLQAMGIQANPVLISTDDKKALVDELPTPRNFDHLTLCASINGTARYFDATIAYQRGRLNDIAYPDYQYGLVITDTTTALTAIKPHAMGEQNIKEVFDVKDMSGNATLVVTTTYTGAFADDERSQFANNSNYDMLQRTKKFYAYYYEKIKSDSLTFTDNDSTGVFTTTEYYTIKDFWTNEKGVKKSVFSPYVITSLLKKPDEQIRTMPYAITYEGKYHEEIIVNLPEKWDVDTSSFNIKNAAFAYSGRFYNIGNEVRMEYNFETFKDNVTPQETDDYLAAVKTANDSEDYKLTYGTETSKNTLHTSTAHNSVYMALGFLLLVGGVVWWTQRRV